MKFDEKTHQAIHHTIHCLIGCGIGEIVGMIIASFFGWHKLARVILATLLAFFFGFLLTYRGVRKQTKSSAEAAKITFATDSVSITTMEIVDNTIEYLIPKALTVTIVSFRFWWGLVLSLSVAFLITVPVNRFMIGRGKMQHHH